MRSINSRKKFSIWPLLRPTVYLLDKAATVIFSSNFHQIFTKLGNFEDPTEGYQIAENLLSWPHCWPENVKTLKLKKSCISVQTGVWMVFDSS